MKFESFCNGMRDWGSNYLAEPSQTFLWTDTANQSSIRKWLNHIKLKQMFVILLVLVAIWTILLAANLWLASIRNKILCSPIRMVEEVSCILTPSRELSNTFLYTILLHNFKVWNLELCHTGGENLDTRIVPNLRLKGGSSLNTSLPQMFIKYVL